MAFAYSDHSALKRRFKGGINLRLVPAPGNFEVSGHGEVFVGVILKISTIFHNMGAYKPFICSIVHSYPL